MDATGATLATPRASRQCASQQLQGQFRQVGDGVWEQRYRVPPGSMNGMDIDSVQRWSRPSAHCSSGR